MRIKKISPEQIRTSLVDQFTYLFNLAPDLAEKAAAEAMADTDLLNASVLAGTKTIEIAVRFGWKPPEDMVEPEEPA